jgi:hypothetical protein
VNLEPGSQDPNIFLGSPCTYGHAFDGGDLPPEKESSFNVRLETKKGGKSWSGKPIYPSKSSTNYAKLKSS